MLNSKARDVVKKYGLSKIIDAFGHSLPTLLQLHNYPNFLTKVDIPGASPRSIHRGCEDELLLLPCLHQLCPDARWWYWQS